MKRLVYTIDRFFHIQKRGVYDFIQIQGKAYQSQRQEPCVLLLPFTRIITDKKGKIIYLTAKEFDLLYFLSSHKGQVFTKEQLYENVWGYDNAPDASNLSSFNCNDS